MDNDSPIKRPRPTLVDRHRKLSQEDDAWSNAADIGSRQNSYHNPSLKVDEQELPSVTEEAPASPLNTAFMPPAQAPQVGKHVRWTPSVAGGSTTTDSPPPASPEAFHQTLSSLPEEETDLRDPLPPELDKFVVSQDLVYPSSTSVLGSAQRSAYDRQGPSAPEIQHSHMSLPPPPLELTNAVIAKIQKHCRFAISALDYEDAEQARTELRTALALLGE